MLDCVLCIFLIASVLLYQVTAVYALSATDIEFGEEQLEKMLADYPQMVNLVNKGDPVWQWAARQFAGELSGVRYYWKSCNVVPSGPFRSKGWHQYPRDGNPGWVTVTSGDVGVRSDH